MKAPFKRAFTKDGQSLSSIKSVEGKRDMTWFNAGIIRIFVIPVSLSVIITVIGLLLSAFTEITFDEYISALKQVKAVFGW